MLIFIKGKYLPLIASGQKTTTIRPWRHCRLVAGGSLSFNGRLRVTLTRVEQRRLCELTDDDAIADGFISRRSFVRVFRAHYGAVTPSSSVWILHFTNPQSVRA